MIARFGALALAGAVAFSTFAQQPLVLGQANPNVLRAGLEVPLTVSEELTTKGKKLKVGQRFQLATAAPVTLNGQTVIPVGAPAFGEVTSVRNKGMWGKSGNIEARVLYLRAGDRQIRLSGTLNDKGTTGTAAVVGSIALIPVAGFFMTGTSAVIPIGAPVKAFLDEDVPVQLAENVMPPALPAPIASTAPSAGLPVDAAVASAASSQ